MSKTLVKQSKKTRYRLLWIWLIASLTIGFFNWFIRGEWELTYKEEVFYYVLGGGFLLIPYYIWREHEDNSST